MVRLVLFGFGLLCLGVFEGLLIGWGGLGFLFGWFWG